MSEHEKKWQRIYDLPNAKTKLKFLCIQKKNIPKKSFFKEKSERKIEQKTN